ELHGHTRRDLPVEAGAEQHVPLVHLEALREGVAQEVDGHAAAGAGDGGMVAEADPYRAHGPAAQAGGENEACAPAVVLEVLDAGGLRFAEAQRGGGSALAEVDAVEGQGEIVAAVV